MNHLKQQNLRALSVLPLEHQLRASVALQRRSELEHLQLGAAERGASADVVRLEALIEVMEGELEQLGVVVS